MNKVCLVVVLLCHLVCIKCYYLPLSLSICQSNGVCTPNATGLVLDSTPASGASQSSFQAAGLTSDGTTLTMTGQRRLYLVNAAENSYQLFKLKNVEFSFDVLTSDVACGGNGALYFTGMPNSGNNYASGAGYCDAPTGCNEMDVWEANEYATALTSHACSSSGCDTNGCQYNPYKQGQTSFYGPGKTVDSSQKFTVVTQFITDSSGNLDEVNRFYVQNGKTITGYSLTISYCSGSNNQGGLTTIGNVAGWVLVFSFWSSNGGMTWLDSSPNGPCTSENFSSGKITFGNIKFGPIGSTTGSSSTAAASSAVASTTAHVTSTSTSAHSSSTTGSASSGGWAVYTDSLQNGFQDYSWDNTRSFTCTSPVHSGTYSISFALSSYGAIYLHDPTTFLIGSYTQFTFYLYTTTAVSGNEILVLLYDGSGNTIGSGQPLPSPVPANTWTLIVIYLSSYQAPASTVVSGCAVQANEAGNFGTGYLDDMYFK